MGELLCSRKVEGANTVALSAEHRYCHKIKEKVSMMLVSSLQGIPTHKRMPYFTSICKIYKGLKFYWLDDPNYPHGSLI